MAKKKTSAKKTASRAPESNAEPYVVLARRYRPQTFDDLIGQDAMVQTLSNAFTTGRIAQGYMLTGVRGVGKTTTARILARALNFETDKVHAPTVTMPELGRHCAEIMESRHPDVLEMDAASHTGVDNIRELIESAHYKPLLARNKIFIIDEVHMLSKGAFNALLKTLEEPPEHVRFIFATTEIRKVPVTVLSRCQRFDLRRVDVPVLAQHFAMIAEKEGATTEPAALALIARAAEGSVRDGLSILDQAIAMGSGNVTETEVRAMLGLADRGRIFDLLDLLFGGEAGQAVEALEGLYRDGADPIQIIADLAEAVHIAARVKVIGANEASESLSGEERRRAKTLADQLSVPILARAWQMLIKGLDEAGRAPNPLSAAEMILIRLAYTSDLPSPEDLIKALDGQSIPAGRKVMKTDTSVQGSLLASAESSPDSKNDAGSELELPQTIKSETGEDLVGENGGNADKLRSFEDVITLVAVHRDAKLKVHLEEHVSLVKFDPAAPSIDLFLLDGAPPEIANELREKLNLWTGRKWIVVLSRTKGELPLGAARRQRQEAAFASIKKQSSVAAVLKEFPDAKIVSVTPLDEVEGEDDDSAMG